MKNKNAGNSFFIKAVAALVWIALWQAAAFIINNPLVLAGPVETLAALGGMIAEAAFWTSVLGSFRRIAAGFLLAVVAAIFFSVCGYKIKHAGEFLAPPMTVFKTVPVASFTILILISLKSKENLSAIICFMMSLPIIYANLLAGLKSIDPKLLEMARIFRIRGTKKYAYLYAQKTLPHFVTGCKTALGLCWKSGVAAELIGLVQNTIGNELYYAKLYLMMDRVFAWTLVIVLLNSAFEFLVLAVLRFVKRGLGK